MQWEISIGRHDIHTVVMTMSRFRVQPQFGHLEQVKRMIGYQCKSCHYKAQFCTEGPDFSAVPCVLYKWSNTAYGNAEEEVPSDEPPSLGNCIVLSHYFYANLMHNVLSGKSVTGVFHLVNKTTLMWYSKK